MIISKLIPGKFVWFEHVSRDGKKAQAFYGEVLGWKVEPFPMSDVTYDMIHAGGPSSRVCDADGWRYGA